MWGNSILIFKATNTRIENCRSYVTSFCGSCNWRPCIKRKSPQTWKRKSIWTIGSQGWEIRTCKLQSKISISLPILQALPKTKTRHRVPKIFLKFQSYKYKGKRRDEVSVRCDILERSRLGFCTGLSRWLHLISISCQMAKFWRYCWGVSRPPFWRLHSTKSWRGDPTLF